MPKLDLEKRSYWQERIDAWQTSGLSAARWCRENNEAPWQFSYWKKQLLLKPVSRGGFSELAAEPIQSAELGLELQVGQVAIRLLHDFDEPALMRVLQLLGRQS